MSRPERVGQLLRQVEHETQVAFDEHTELFNLNNQLKAENAKLVDVLHEVERDAIHAYHCLQQDCVTITNSADHFFKRWRHAERELSRMKAENAKLRDFAHGLLTGYECGHGELCEGCAWTGMEGRHEFRCPVRVKARKLGIEVDE